MQRKEEGVAVRQAVDDRRHSEKAPERFLTFSPLLCHAGDVGAIALMAKSFRGFGRNNDAERTATSAPADNDDALPPLKRKKK